MVERIEGVVEMGWTAIDAGRAASIMLATAINSMIATARADQVLLEKNPALAKLLAQYLVSAPALLGVAKEAPGLVMPAWEKVWDADPFFTSGDPAFPMLRKITQQQLPLNTKNGLAFPQKASAGQQAVGRAYVLTDMMQQVVQGTAPAQAVTGRPRRRWCRSSTSRGCRSEVGPSDAGPDGAGSPRRRARLLTAIRAAAGPRLAARGTVPGTDGRAGRRARSRADRPVDRHQHHGTARAGQRVRRPGQLPRARRRRPVPHGRGELVRLHRVRRGLQGRCWGWPRPCCCTTDAVGGPCWPGCSWCRGWCRRW